jgi:hypothetical protein
MAQTLRGVYFPSASEEFVPRAGVQVLAESVTGTLVAVASASQAEQLRVSAAPTASRPLYVHRTDNDTVWASQGGAFAQIGAQPAVGFCEWGKPASQQLTDSYVNLIGWIEQSQGGVRLAQARSDGTFLIQVDGLYELSARVPLASAAAVANTHTHLRIYVNDVSAMWTFASLGFAGFKRLDGSAIRALRAGDVVAVRITVAPAATGVSTYGSSESTVFSLAKIG